MIALTVMHPLLLYTVANTAGIFPGTGFLHAHYSISLTISLQYPTTKKISSGTNKPSHKT